MKADVILGLQWGDEGKGKIVDLLSPGYDIIARFQGGPNAGHTIEINGSKHVLHLIPSGIFHPGIVNIIGNGVILDPCIFLGELEKLLEKGINPVRSLFISKRAHLILPTHRLLDACQEQAKKEQKIGSTLKGIGPAYTDKTARNGLRAGEINAASFRDRYQQLRDQHLRQIDGLKYRRDEVLIDGFSLDDYERQWLTAVEALKEYRFLDVEIYLNQALDQGKKVLAEGAQGTLLDVDFGAYPYVTSSNTTIGGVSTGLGIPPSKIGEVFGVFKAYCTRVGNGPFPTELHDDTGQQLRDQGHEYGSTTGRPRRCGWLDLPALRYATMINGVSRLIMMKADVMNNFEEVKICTHYRHGHTNVELPAFDDGSGFSPLLHSLQGWNKPLENIQDPAQLPENFTRFLRFIEESTRLRISIVSLGPERNQTLYLQE